MNITELNGTALNSAGGVIVPDTLGFYGRTVRAASGAAIENAEVFVFDTAGNPVDVWSAGVDGSPEILDQPLLTDVTGAFKFYAPFGTYRITVEFLGETVTLNNQQVGPDRAYVDKKEPALPAGTLAYFPERGAPLGWIDATQPVDEALYQELVDIVGRASPPSFLEAISAGPLTLVSAANITALGGLTPATDKLRAPRLGLIGERVYASISSGDPATDANLVALVSVDPANDYLPSGETLQIPKTDFRDPNLDVNNAPKQGRSDVIMYVANSGTRIAGLRVAADGTTTALEFSAQDVTDGNFDTAKTVLSYDAAGGLGVGYFDGAESDFFVIDETNFTLLRTISEFGIGTSDPALNKIVVSDDGARAIFCTTGGDFVPYLREHNVDMQTYAADGPDGEYIRSGVSFDLSKDLKWAAGFYYSFSASPTLVLTDITPWWDGLEAEGPSNVDGTVNNNSYEATVQASKVLAFAADDIDSLVSIEIAPDSSSVAVRADFYGVGEQVRHYAIPSLDLLKITTGDASLQRGAAGTLSPVVNGQPTFPAVLELSNDAADGSVQIRKTGGGVLPAGQTRLPSPPIIGAENADLKPYIKTPEV